MGGVIWLLILVALLVAVGLYLVIDSTLLFGFFPSFALSGIESDIRANWGALGDVMGGLLNPILTFISIVLLIQTIRISQKTLRQTEESLQTSNRMLEATYEQIDLNRQELSNTRVEIARASSAQEEISKTQRLQREENTFYQAFKMYTDAAFNLKKPVREGMARTWIRDAISGLHGIEDDEKLKEKIEIECSSKRDLSILIRFCFLCLQLSGDNRNLGYLISSVLDTDLKIFIMLYGYYVDSAEAIEISNAINRGELDLHDAAMLRIIRNQEKFIEAAEGFSLITR